GGRDRAGDSDGDSHPAQVGQLLTPLSGEGGDQAGAHAIVDRLVDQAGAARATKPEQRGTQYEVVVAHQAGGQAQRSAQVGKVGLVASAGGWRRLGAQARRSLAHHLGDVDTLQRAIDDAQLHLAGQGAPQAVGAVCIALQACADLRSPGYARLLTTEVTQQGTELDVVEAFVEGEVPLTAARIEADPASVAAPVECR
ncbi:hypothetical protein RZS08_52530, partial [Arthrospira platensis SPKY1]|nr:hypothetical protein [Arthrospira platensis SPKY1]